MQLKVTESEGGYALEGELDMSTANELGDLIRSAPGDAEVVLDFAGITFMDSSGLRVLLEAAGERPADRPLVVLNPSPQVRRVLDISIPGGTPGLEVRP